MLKIASNTLDFFYPPLYALKRTRAFYGWSIQMFNTSIKDLNLFALKKRTCSYCADQCMSKNTDWTFFLSLKAW